LVPQRAVIVGDDAGMAAGVEDVALERLAVEILGAAAAQPQRRVALRRGAHHFGESLDH
jgi:hypothetical protein